MNPLARKAFLVLLITCVLLIVFSVLVWASGSRTRAENASLKQEVATLQAGQEASDKAAVAREKRIAQLLQERNTRDKKVSQAMARPEVKEWADQELPTALQEALQ